MYRWQNAHLGLPKRSLGFQSWSVLADGLRYCTTPSTPNLPQKEKMESFPIPPGKILTFSNADIDQSQSVKRVAQEGCQAHK
jgi:hypothetical protein